MQNIAPNLSSIMLDLLGEEGGHKLPDPIGDRKRAMGKDLGIWTKKEEEPKQKDFPPVQN